LSSYAKNAISDCKLHKGVAAVLSVGIVVYSIARKHSQKLVNVISSYVLAGEKDRHADGLHATLTTVMLSVNSKLQLSKVPQP